jgi:YfiH family protein
MKFYQSKLLNKYSNLTHLFTSIKDGNLAFHVNDSRVNVINNHTYIANQLHYDINKLIHMNQIHSNIVKIVDEYDDFNNPPTCDALITNKTGIPLMVMVADCSPVFFYDKKQKVIAVAHAGRAGTFKNIIKNVLDSFINNFNSNAKDIIINVGPAICSNCYEVGVEIYNETKDINLEYAIIKKNKKYYLDIRSILKKQMLDLDIDENNIEISDICNCCNSDVYFSYRANNKTGRFAGILKIQ